MNNSTKQIREKTLKLQELANHYFVMAVKGTYNKEDVLLKLKSIYYDVDSIIYETAASRQYIRDSKEHIQNLIEKMEDK